MRVHEVQNVGNIVNVDFVKFFPERSKTIELLLVHGIRQNL